VGARASFTLWSFAPCPPRWAFRRPPRSPDL